MSDRTREKLIKAGLYIVLMAVIVLAVFLVMRPMIGKLLGHSGLAGQGDWEYRSLPGAYEIWRINSEDISLVKVDKEDDSHGHNVVGPYISAFWYDDRYIVVKQYPGRSEGSYDKFYYCIDAETDDVYGPLDESGFSFLKTKLGIRIEQWILTVPKPDEAEY